MVSAYLPYRLVNYYLARKNLLRPAPPINLTFSITNKCQSHCQTCHIWKIYQDNPEAKKEELSLGEIEQTFGTMDPVFFFNISGGCPFLRDDLPEIIKLASVYLKPRVIHIPSNGLEPDRIMSMLSTILKDLSHRSEGTYLQIKPSMDGLGACHDRIRGTKGNFDKLLLLMENLKTLQKSYPKLQVGLGTIISTLNIDRLGEIIKFIDQLEIDSYIAEIAEIREEMLNASAALTPRPEDYRQAVGLLCRHFGKRPSKSVGLTKFTRALRLIYYPLSLRILSEARQVIPCYAAFSNVHLSAYGEVWSCATLGSKKSLGNLREQSYNFRKIWQSKKANDVRDFIISWNCSCPLANQAYANMLLHPATLIKALKLYLSLP
ncbi:MAG: radical SAM protein [Candidatus Tectomicrobia bacterium]|uniref:Radical SAM protein n=1 Tax=Tectimicrobiota bacterium TaxID=2528274 RepID=A0A933GMV8_UNCTE|nr:radical SAM protein [Candidatus Tectomicrobia bacterium]